MTAAPARPGAGTVIGAGCWILTVAYLLVQPVVAAAWPTPYDLATNSISDLGVTGCGDFRQFDDRVVYACSPRRALLQVPGAVGPLLLGVAAWSMQRGVAAFSVLCGVVGSAASLLYFSQVYLGLGPGGMEHLAFDPLTVWTTVLGFVLLGRWLAARRATR